MLCVFVCCFFFFFFSSRRRHTRCSRDWSSDVCSSDLTASAGGGGTCRGGRPNLERRTGFCTSGAAGAFCEESTQEAYHVALILRDPWYRSEERRVGKECRSRGWAYHKKKKEAKEEDDD